MTSEKMYFATAEGMRRSFAAIIENDPAMAGEGAFHDALLQFAGAETNPQHAVLIITQALGARTKNAVINLSGYAEAVLVDAEAIAAVKGLFEGFALTMAEAGKLVLPAFPSNPLGIRRGTVIRSNHADVENQLGVKVGEAIPIGFDGKYIRCGPFSWDMEQLIQEIDHGYWVIAGHIDLSNKVVSLHFARDVERL